MKKLFVSLPMKGRTEENVRKSVAMMKKVAEATFGEELEVLPIFVEYMVQEGTNEDVWYLGWAIQMLAQADYMIGVRDLWYEDFGCTTEENVARQYGIKFILVDVEYAAPDICKRRMEYEAKCLGDLR